MTKRLSSRNARIAMLLCGLASCGGSTSSSDTSEGGIAGGGAGSGGNTTCLNASVTFQMIPWRPDGAAPADYCAGMGCGGQWLSIKTAAGKDLNRFFLCGTTCSDCSAKPCPPIACILPDHLPPQGA